MNSLSLNGHGRMQVCFPRAYLRMAGWTVDDGGLVECDRTLVVDANRVAGFGRSQPSLAGGALLGAEADEA